MTYAYMIMFFTGVLYAFVSFIISGISGLSHFGSHIDSGGTHIHTQGDMGGHSADASGHDVQTDSGGAHTMFSWFSILINPIVAVSFFTVFGGIGIMGTERFKWAAAIVFAVALAAGVITATLLYKFVAVPLYKSENSSGVSRDELVSTPAEVITDIIENGFGTIKYTVNSIRYTAPAKHMEGTEVKQGRKVIICKIEDNVFYVTEMEEL
jgi:hypothetical protein